MLKKENGFTLIEMLIVLMIITVLIILIVPHLSGRSKEVHDKGCDALVSVVQAQVYLYHLEKGKYPTSISSLVPEYITEDQKTCPNDKPLIYTNSNGKVTQPRE